MWGCMRYLSVAGVLPEVGDVSSPHCVEKQRVAGEQSAVLLNSTDSKTYLNHSYDPPEIK